MDNDNKLHTSSTGTTSACDFKESSSSPGGDAQLCWGDIYGAVTAPRMFLLRSPLEPPGFQDYRKQKTWGIFKGECAFSRNTNDQLCTVIIQFWTLGINSTWQHFITEKQDWESPSSSHKWSRLLVAISNKRHQRITGWACTVDLSRMSESDNLLWRSKAIPFAGEE